MMVEPSGAAALAAVLHGAVPEAGAATAIVISGGNVDPSSWAEWVAEYTGTTDQELHER